MAFDVVATDPESGAHYLGTAQAAFLHLVPSGNSETVPMPQIEHFAFRAANIGDLERRLAAASVPFRRIRRGEVVAIDFRDPDGNRLHVDFPAEDRE